MTLSADYTLTPAEEARAKLLWLDLEIISEALQDPPCLDFRRKRLVRNGDKLKEQPPIYSGAEALDALRRKDWETFGTLVHAGINAIIRDRAVDELSEEAGEETADSRTWRKSA